MATWEDRLEDGWDGEEELEGCGDVRVKVEALELVHFLLRLTTHDRLVGTWPDGVPGDEVIFHVV